MLKKMVVASNNSAKTREIQRVFAEFGIQVINYRELISEKIFPTETATDQYQNALAKAQFIRQFLPDSAILADDTAAYFKAFPNRFGLTIARELKSLGLKTIREEDAYLLSLYHDNMDRHAYLEALFVLVMPDGSVYHSIGRGGVTLAQSERGAYSVGFDTLFESENGKTFAEMQMSERVNYSHRGRAAKMLLEKIANED
ncbi:non-canonical purine NTP pyrophosphatase [Leuconostoc citreum]|jgi:XTP/dITP diphosphohydrolase|uniref:Xanthosine triphosphate pyrophosphatase n=2 Tax=Leuconostoc citreum TaxID=33964 RepID=B1MZ40_LEUCK|nr:non-canonical purine NTP pyrophosphatase [Leuconostoc citreum]ACA82792.1 Xanthosine triphosphate pyrophosphatase [Leuconostoc citreum KM20]MCJ2168048.1 non-canonical purine NTP pyrophosphatase [Leuconostoc citreum]MCK8605586.1 non-canonical purine NTP pyrophosphatase [Leuconostoc citreum]MDM7642275.1 non-canonical purine NTP pyrophosphatase [Leuconostoc citreum]MDV8931040.1 non-canonical purine NTP pyrophosphatase [Leuconostoc citreum]